MLYSLFFYSVTRENGKNEDQTNSYSNENISAQKVKLSIQQIDSITAFENYKFTIENYYNDVVPKKMAIEKISKI
jgi:hypothetical protein